MALDESFAMQPKFWPFGFGMLITQTGVFEVEEGDRLYTRIMARPDGFDVNDGRETEAVEFIDANGGPQTYLVFKDEAAVRRMIETLDELIVGYHRYKSDKPND